MATRAAAEKGEATGGAGRNCSALADQCGFRPAGRPLFPKVLLVLGHRHRLHLVAVHSDGPSAGAALSWLREGETILDVDKVRILQHGLSPLLYSMVVLALVLLVVGEYLVSQKGTCLGCQMG